MGRSAGIASAAALAFAGAACNPYSEALPPPACRTTADCPAGLACAEDGRCREVGVMALSATFGPSAALGDASARVRLALLPTSAGALQSGSEARVRTFAAAPPEAPATIRLEMDRLPVGPFLALVVLDARPAMAAERIDVCPEDRYGRAHVRIRSTGAVALGATPGREEPAVDVALPGGASLCARER